VTNQQVIAIFEQHKPSEPEQVKDLGFGLEHVGSGGARLVYRVIRGKQKTGLVIKFDQNGGLQNQREIQAMKKFHNDPQMEMLRVHTPPLYYESPDQKLIVTKYYATKLPPGDDPELNNFMSKMEQAGVGDLFYKNVSKDRHGRFVAIDLGYYRGTPEPEND
jgi:hypothetical protein